MWDREKRKRFHKTNLIVMWVSAAMVAVGMLAMIWWIACAESKRDEAQDKLAAEQKTTAMLEEMLERRDKAIGEYDERLSVACEGLWACNWQETMGGAIFDARDIDDWTEAMRQQDAGLKACRKAYPKGSEYQGGTR